MIKIGRECNNRSLFSPVDNKFQYHFIQFEGRPLPILEFILIALIFKLRTFLTGLANWRVIFQGEK